MKVLIFRSSYYAHIEEIVNYILENKWSKPDLVVLEKDFDRYSKMENAGNVYAYKSGHTFKAKKSENELIKKLKENKYDMIIIPCRNKKPWGYSNVCNIAKKIEKPSKIYYVNPKLEFYKHSLILELAEKFFVTIAGILKFRSFMCSLVPRKEKMLIVCLGYLGDTVSVMRALKYLKEKNNNFYVLIKKEYKELSSLSGLEDKTLLWKRNFFRNIFLIFKINFVMRFERACILFAGGKTISVSLIASGIKEVYGYENPDFYYPFDFVINNIMDVDAKNFVEYSLKPILKMAGEKEMPEIFPKLIVVDDKGGKSVLFAPQSRWLYRVIFPDKLRVVADKIFSDTSFSVCVYCSEDYHFEMKKELGDEYLKKIKWQEFYSNLSELIEFLRNYDVVVGVDTGVTHLAAALGKKVFCIVGPSAFSTLIPEGEAVNFYVKNLPCRPCQQYVEMNCPRDYVCIRNIDYESVAKSVVEYLKIFG